MILVISIIRNNRDFASTMRLLTKVVLMILFVLYREILSRLDLEIFALILGNDVLIIIRSDQLRSLIAIKRFF